MLLRILNLITPRATGNPDAATSDAQLGRARSLHEQGQAADAAAICEDILSVNPDHYDAVMLSAEIASAAGDRQHAIRRYAKAAGLKPTQALPHYKLGNLLKDGEQPEAALGPYDRAIALEPGHAKALCNRGVVLQRLDRPDEALASYDQAIATSPDDALTYYNRGAVLRELKRPEAALASLDHALALQPNYAEAHCNRGILCQELKYWDAASAAYDRAIEINPDFSEAHLNRGNLLRERKDLSGALASYDRAVDLNRGHAAAHCYRGVALTELKRWDAAFAGINRAIELEPAFAEAYNARGRLWAALMRKEAALADFDQAIACNPEYAEAFCNRGDALNHLKQYVAAIASYDHAFVLQPDLRHLLGLRRHARMYVCDWTDLGRDADMLIEGIQADEAVSHPFPLLGLLDAPALHHQAAQIWVRKHHPADDSLGALPMRAAEARIRIGYFSADFRDHPVAILAAELFERHDRTRHEIFAFSFGRSTDDGMRRRIEAAVDRFIDAREMSDRDIALLSRSLGIDIAVDLGGHTDECRTQVFALRAAPIQVNYLGYPGTLGADYIDYLIGDATVVPEAQRRHYSEKIAYLPHSFMPHDSNRQIAGTAFTRQDFGLPPAGFVFCCFNNNYKIVPTTFESWMRILGRVDDSVLWLFENSPVAAANLRQEALRRGIDAGRLIFARHLPSPQEHLARLRLADLFLDTRPYNAHATALDALWAGVPVLTCRGEGFAGRVAASLLKAIDLPELVTSTSGQYEDCAVELAGNPQRLEDIRQKLARNRHTAPLFDTASLVKHIERAYAEMYRRHVAQLPPDHIHLDQVTEWEALNDLATRALQAGDSARALALYDGAIARTRDHAEAHYKRANVLNGLSRWAEALADYDRATELQPGHAKAHCNRGAVLEHQERWDEALASYGRSIALDPGDFLSFYNRASTFRTLGRFHEALADYDQAIALKSDYAEAYINRGNVLRELLQDEAALASYDRAVELTPIHAEAFQGRGSALFTLGRFAAAIASFDQALCLQADMKFVPGMRRYAKMMMCDWDEHAIDVQLLTQGLRADMAVSAPFPMLSLLDSAALQHRAARIWVREHCPPRDTLAAMPARICAGKIRIGYFSPDFRDHAVSQLAAGLFDTHDRSKFEIIAFAFGPAANDPLRARLERSFDRFIDVSDLSDVEVALLGRRLGIDIAVDLGGFTQHSRTKIFALRAAPLQIAYLGYPGTLGAGYMDYVIADRTVVPEAQQGHYTEKIVCLPHCFLPHDSSRRVSATVFSRETLGLPAAGFVFCCFNNAYKIMPATFDGWMRILRRVDDGVLWLSFNNAEAVANLRKEAVRRGVAAERLIFAHRMPSLPEHLARLRVADLFLDTRPYNAHATAVDALWAGLPLLTCMGDGFAGRVAASLLKAIELPELITSTMQQYEDLAVQLAANPPQLAAIRRRLATNRLTTPLFDTKSLTRHLEAAYMRIQERHEAQLPPEHLVVPP